MLDELVIPEVAIAMKRRIFAVANFENMEHSIFIDLVSEEIFELDDLTDVREWTSSQSFPPIAASFDDFIRTAIMSAAETDDGFGYWNPDSYVLEIEKRRGLA